tara:strand:+ start:592 stop:738 length:147 start_codon:yes stop_codon:yes gene_type:complete
MRQIDKFREWDEQVNKGEVPKNSGLHTYMTLGFILIWPIIFIIKWIGY